jgi:hypothetical protein
LAVIVIEKNNTNIQINYSVSDNLHFKLYLTSFPEDNKADICHAQQTKSPTQNTSVGDFVL